MEITSELLGQLQGISISTLRRRLQCLRPEGDRLPRMRRRGRTRNTVQAQVPVGVIPWDEPEPGHFEVDLVHHGRPGDDGNLVYTIQFIDVLTGWSERFAILGHAFGPMWRAFRDFTEHCPIPVREVHSDNGPEFMNEPLLAYFGEKLQDALFSRGRCGHSNDNRFVEQKNYTLVRAYLGDLYLHTRQHATLLNELYADMWLYYNFFQPVLRQIERTVVIKPNGICRIVRKQDEAKTPLDRLLSAKPPLSRTTSQHLIALYDHTNPRVLKAKFHAQLRRLYQLALQDDGKEKGPR